MMPIPVSSEITLQLIDLDVMHVSVFLGFHQDVEVVRNLESPYTVILVWTLLFWSCPLEW